MRRPAVRLLAVVLAVLAALSASTAAFAAVQGPDVSRYQHPNGYSIDWTSAHAAGGAAFAFVKATEGTGYTNPYFSQDFAGLAKAKMVRGAYHFARPTVGTASAVAQANHFVAVTGTLKARGDLPGVLDLEVNGGLSPASLIAWTKAYLARVTALTGRTPIVYSYPYFWRTAMANTTVFRSYPLWIATYGPAPSLVGGWTRYTFWQYTDAGKLAGMAAPVDMSVFNGTLAQLNALANGGPVGAPAPIPTVKPTAPRTVIATPGAARLTLAWTPPATTGGALTAYTVTVAGKQTKLAPTARTYTATGLKPLLRYAVSVSATNAAGAGPAVQLTAVPMVPTVITLTPGASTGAVGAARQVVARVVRSDTGAPGAAMAVTVRVAPRLGATPTVYTARTDATGRVAIKLSPTVNTDVSVARSAMSSWTAATGSAAVTVRPTLTATLNITSVRVGGSATLAGTTHTSLAGQSVQRQGYYSGAWHLWATTTVAANGSYRFTIKPTKKATNVYRILMPATVGHGAAASPSVTLKAS